jgi:hypothetical protein
MMRWRQVHAGLIMSVLADYICNVRLEVVSMCASAQKSSTLTAPTVSAHVVWLDATQYSDSVVNVPICLVSKRATDQSVRHVDTTGCRAGPGAGLRRPRYSHGP